MRALLIVNPKATATTPRARDVLFRALGSDLKVDVVETERRGHAIELGRDATEQGLDLVVALGGDGTVNEVVNGLLTHGPDPSVPALAVVPGGSTNVFTRALGLSRDPVEATSEILDALRAGRTRRVGLGQADERWFTFTAGLGLDADAVRTVERHRHRGRRASPWLYVGAAMSRYPVHALSGEAHLTLEIPGEAPVHDLRLGIVSNTSPWTYLGSRPVYASPDASFEKGLDLLALRRLGLVATLRTAVGMLSKHATGPRGRAVVSRHDLVRFRLLGSSPLPFQVDGDFLGERTSLTCRAVPAALRVIC